MYNETRVLQCAVDFDCSSSYSYSVFVLGPLACFPSELIWNYEYYKQLLGLLRRVISPVAWPLPTQDDINREETRADICALSGIRTRDPRV
jgi:hypothetical protein